MERYLRTDEYEEAISALEFLSELIPTTASDVYRWKWVILALHSAMQGFMVLALRGSNGLAALKDDVAKAWLGAQEKGTKLPEERLDRFESLYKKIKHDQMLIYSNSKKFSPTSSQGRSVNKLKDLRDDFIHFVPKGWSLEVSGLPTLCQDCLAIIEFLGWDCGNVIWHELEVETRAKNAIAKARSEIAELVI